MTGSQRGPGLAPTVLLVRHGQWEPVVAKGGVKREPLDAIGRKQVQRLGAWLDAREFRPDLVLTSKKEHASETATAIAAAVGLSAVDRIIELDALTPPPAKQPKWIPSCLWQKLPAWMKAPASFDPLEPENNLLTWDAVIEEAGKAPKSRVDVAASIAVVSHEPRLSQLVMRLCSERVRPLGRGEAICVAADSHLDLLKGKGRIDYRVPVVDFLEEPLREKVGSKMTVATFLAGFTFAALVELLIADNRFQGWTVSNTAAVILFALSATLFIAAAYAYDILAMPPGFWSYDERGQRWWGPCWMTRLFGRTIFEAHQHQHGPLYAHMVWTWTYVFGLALAFGVLGFTTIVLATGDLWVIAGGLGAALLGIAYYWRTRPKLGSD